MDGYDPKRLWVRLHWGFWRGSRTQEIGQLTGRRQVALHSTQAAHPRFVPAVPVENKPASEQAACENGQNLVAHSAFDNLLKCGN